MMSNKEIIKIIYDILNTEKVDACYIFGSFLTNRFDKNSDIDIAILGNISLENILDYERKLEEKIGIDIDLVNIEDLPRYIQLQAVCKNKRLIFKENNNTFRYLDELNKWYKEEYPFWLKLQKEQGFEV